MYKDLNTHVGITIQTSEYLVGIFCKGYNSFSCMCMCVRVRVRVCVHVHVHVCDIFPYCSL